MPTTTSNMAVTKPATSEPADITVINANVDKLDGHRHGGGTGGQRVQVVQAGLASAAPGQHVAGQLWAATDTGQLLLDTGSLCLGPGSVKLAETVLAVNAMNVVLSNIPQMYRHLLLVISGRNDGANLGTTVSMQFNGSTSSYWSQTLDAWGGTAVASDRVSTASGRLGMCPGSQSPAGQCSIITIFPNYANSTISKSWVATGSWLGARGEGGIGVEMSGGHLDQRCGCNSIDDLGRWRPELDRGQ